VSGTSVTGNTAQDDLLVAVINFTKEFLTDPVIPGGSSMLRFTIEVDANSPTDATNILFTDNLSAMLSGTTISAAPANGSCGAGSVFSAGGGFLSMTGGTLSPGGSCTFDIEVNIPVSANNNTYSNITSNMSAVVDGNTVLVPPALDELTVNNELIQLEKSFTGNPYPNGSTSANVLFTVTNLDGVNALDGVAFTDDLEAFLSGSTYKMIVSNSCGASITGTSTLDVSNIDLAAGASCTFEVELNIPGSASSGTYVNTTSAPTGTIGGLAVEGQAASADLVIGDVGFSKVFSGSVAAGDTTDLTFTITNFGSTALTDLDFSDDLDAMLTGAVSASGTMTNICGAGSTLSGTSTLTLDGGNLAANGGTCSFTVKVSVPCSAATGTYPNTTSELREQNIPFTGVSATANLSVTGSLPPSITTCPPTSNVEGCDTGDIMNGSLTALAYSTTEVTITEAQFTAEGGTFSGTPAVIKYQDSSTGTCPIVVTRTYTITNDCGTTNCSQTINIDDDTDPVISTCPPTRNVEGCDTGDIMNGGLTALAYSETDVTITNTQFTNEGGAITEACGYTIKYKDSSTGTCPIVITRTFTVTDDCGNPITCDQTINIDDDTAPSITGTLMTLNEEGCVASAASAAYTMVSELEAAGVMISDVCTSDANLVVTYSDASTGTCPIVVTRTYTVKDACGNGTNATQTINVDDSTAPSITGTLMTLNEEGCTAGAASAAYTMVSELEAAGVMISDVCTSDANLVVTYSDASTGTCPIVVTRTYTVKDACGNGTNATQTINVNDTTVPTPLCQPVTVELNSSGLASLTATQVDNGSSDLCSGVSLSIDITSFDCNDLGDHTVTLTVTDDCNNVNTCTAIVTVEDNIAPVVTCKDATIQLDATGNVILSPFKVYNSTSDNCAIATLSVSPNTFDCMDIGTHTVTLTATDYGGNPATCTATVTVEDTMAPIAKCKDHTVQLDNSGVGTLSVSDVDDGSSDNCGIATSSLDLPASFDCDDIGTHLATLSLTDVNGNSSSCTATVTVVDDMDPEAKCKDITITCPGGIVTIDPSEVDDGSTDNCSFSLSLNQTILPCSSTPVTVTLTATDASGNVDDCTSLVTFNVQTGTTSLSINNVSKLEGNWFGFTFYQFEVERTGGVGATSVDYATADGTAEVANNDYIPATGTLNWTSGGSNFQYFTVLVRKDNFPEMDEIFYVNLSNPTGGAVIGNGQGEGEILDDDTPSPSPLVNNDDELAQSHVQISKYRPTLFPNPTQEELFISLPNSWLEDSQNVKAELYDNSGKMMRSFDLSQQESKIEVYDLRNGMYHLVFFPKNGEIISERFVKMD
jgi:hypothetical protein